MGIPRARARAALKRTKGDAMGAAERVFAGEYDDIPSDQEDEDTDSDSDDDSIIVSGVTGQSKKDVIVMISDDDDDREDLGNGFSSDFVMEDDDVFVVDDEDDENERLWCDPYAGVFFSTDRAEKIIEPVEAPSEVQIKIQGTENTVPVLSRGEWMSGCPEEGEQSHLFQLYSILESPFSCPYGCGGTIHREPSQFFAIFSDFTDYTAHLTSVLRPACSNCKGVVCLACGETVDRKAVKRLESLSNMQPGEYDQLLHCVNIQGLIIGMGLYMIQKSFETLEKTAGLDSGSGSVPTESPAKKKQKTSNKTTTTWLIEGENGTGYDGDEIEDHSGQLRAEMEQEKRDKNIMKLLSQVRVYLPNVSRPSGSRSSDHMVHPTALANLRRRSGFVNDLLRNDSLLDMSNRRGLYEELFNWLEVVSSHESLASMLAMPQMRSVSEFPDPDQPGQKIVMYEGSPSPRELLESCVIQAQAAIRGLSSTLPVAREGERSGQGANLQLQAFCERIIGSAKKIDRSLVRTKGRAFVDRMLKGLPKLPDSNAEPEELVANQGRTGESIVKTYETWVTKTRFQYCDMSKGTNTCGNLNYSHAFNTQFQSTSNLHAPKRSLAIAKELAILTRNLPVAWHSSIFLRVDEARVDCLKAMIIGPEGTPYENGCFLFDIFLPAEYNHRCPNVKSMTTNGGRFRYNPNLYADGKVCLSLLGTWSGPGWISGKSTLLQVLISIQSLILCEEPYLNEPDLATKKGTSASQDYSANVRRMVLIDAMANNLKNPPHPFENEIKTHFRLKADYIRDQIDRWKKIDNGGCVARQGPYSPSGGGGGGVPAGSPGTFDHAADQMKKLLSEITSSETVSKTHKDNRGRGKGKGKAKGKGKGKGKQDA